MYSIPQLPDLAHRNQPSTQGRFSTARVSNDTPRLRHYALHIFKAEGALANSQQNGIAGNWPRSRLVWRGAELVLRVQNSPTVAELKTVLMVESDTITGHLGVAKQFQITPQMYNEPKNR